VAQHIANLVTLVEKLELSRVTLLAHDWGAPSAGTVLKLPERFSRIILFNTGAFPPPFVPLDRRLPHPALGTLPSALQRLRPRGADNGGGEAAAGGWKAGLVAPYDSWANRIARSGLCRTFRFAAHPTWKLLADIEAGLCARSRPSQLIWGMKDWCFRPECLNRFVEHWPQAEVPCAWRTAAITSWKMRGANRALVRGFLEKDPIHAA